MRGLTIVMLIALIAFVIAIVSLGLEFFGVLDIQNSMTHISTSYPLLDFSSYKFIGF
ncbi:MAG: hypothetical protein ACE5RI_00850 [Candidatus Nitrosomaritimum yanchengensis]